MADYFTPQGFIAERDALVAATPAPSALVELVVRVRVLERYIFRGEDPDTRWDYRVDVARAVAVQQGVSAAARQAARDAGLAADAAARAALPVDTSPPVETIYERAARLRAEANVAEQQVP